MGSSILDRLDEIARVQTFSSELAVEAHTLMGGGRSDDLAILIERYGDSDAPNIAQALASVLAMKAQQPTQEMAQLVLAFIARFRCWNPAESVMNSLTAVQHCLHYVDPSEGEALRSLSPFLRRCLDYNGRHWVIIKGHALALLPIVWKRDLVNKIFTGDELVWLGEKVRELRGTAGDELREELLPLEDVIDL